jgi:hypothetical protein
MENVQMTVEGNILTVRVDLGEELQRQAEQWQQAADLARKQWEESQWYLGEAQAAVRRLEEQLQGLQVAYGQLEARHGDLTARLQEVERERGEANASLRELQGAQEGLLQQVQQLTGQLVQAQGNLEEMRRLAEDSQQRFYVERAKRQAIEAELVAVRTHWDRRRVSRVYRPGVAVELQDPDGTVLFRGLARNVSRMGFGFASEEPITDFPDVLQVRLYLPGVESPVEAKGRLAWRGQDAMIPNNYLGGCELRDLPADWRQTFEEVLAKAA